MLDVLKDLPLITAATWYLVVAYQVYRDRMRTWTEAFFLAACFFTATYALSDFYFFTADRVEAAATAARLSLTSLTLGVLFFFLFTQVYLTKMRRLYFAFLVPGMILIPFLWTYSLTGLVLSNGSFLPQYNPIVFVPWLGFVVLMSATGISNLWKLHRIVRSENRTLGKRSAGILVSFTIVFFFGLLTNGVIGSLPNVGIPPPFSTLLVIPGIVAFLTLAPLRRDRISEVVRRFRARRYEMRVGYLIFNDGTLIASRAREGSGVMDRDIFSATLDVIQNFMRTSFPILRGTSLRTIEHGDHRIIIERGHLCYLTLVIVGEENDLLRRQMRDELLAFEAVNEKVLQQWQGVPSDAIGADALLQRMFEPQELFGH